MRDSQRETSDAPASDASAPDASTTGFQIVAPAARMLARWNTRAISLLRGGALRDERAEGPILEVESTKTKAATPLAGSAGYKLTLLLFVVIPSFFVVIYFAFLATNQYVSETKFALRMADQSQSKSDSSDANSKGGGALSSMSLPSAADQDAYIVASFIRSSAAFAELGKHVDVRKIYTRPEADFWARLPTDASLETLTSYWRDMVTASVDSLSGIVTVTVRSFRPQDSLALADAITKVSERLVNDISARARADTMARAEDEVKKSERKVQDALIAMREFRNQEGMISPTSSADATSKLLLAAMADRIKLQTEYSTAERVMSRNAPTLVVLTSRLAAVDKEIGKLKGQLTGESAKTVANSITRFEEVELQRQYSEKIYMMSQDALERARQEAERQTVYLTAFVPAFLPQESLYPHRVESSLLIPLGLLVVWGIFAMLAATIEDHRL